MARMIKVMQCRETVFPVNTESIIKTYQYGQIISVIDYKSKRAKIRYICWWRMGVPTTEQFESRY